jgi:2,4-dienoyl-CoA reductase-like NADH-dependent reductase (Old Yellow Enzyme family)
VACDVVFPVHVLIDPLFFLFLSRQVKQWTKVVDAVHAKGGFIWMQLWALGRANGGQQPHIPVVAPSPIGLKGDPTPASPSTTSPDPKELSDEDIKRYIAAYGKAAENAKKAGFDGVEIHGANGYLIDQASPSKTHSYIQLI